MKMFTREVQDVHRVLAPRTRIEHFVEALDPRFFGLTSRDQFYAPVKFAVQISGPIGSAAGAISVSVPVHANADGWLPLMKRRFARMIGMPQLRDEEMAFKTVTGKPLQDVPLDVLARVGKLNLYVQGELMRLPEVPPIPVEYSTNKMADIGEWIAERIEQALPDLLTRELQKHCGSAAALEQALLPDGPVQRVIEQCVMGRDAAQWTEFCRTRHMHSPEELPAEEARNSAKLIARDALIHLRALVEAAAPQIKEGIGAQEAARAATALQRKAGAQDAHLYAPLLGSNAAASHASVNALPDLMQGLADETCASPALHKAIASALHTRPLGDGCRWAVKKRGAAGGAGAGGGGRPGSILYSNRYYDVVNRAPLANFDISILDGDQAAQAAYTQWVSVVGQLYAPGRQISEADVMQSVRDYLINAQAVSVDTAFDLIRAPTVNDERARVGRIMRTIYAAFALDGGAGDIASPVELGAKIAELRDTLQRKGLPLQFKPAVPKTVSYKSQLDQTLQNTKQWYRSVRPEDALVEAGLFEPPANKKDDVAQTINAITGELEAARNDWTSLWKSAARTVKGFGADQGPPQEEHIKQLKNLCHPYDLNPSQYRFIGLRIFSVQLLAADSDIDGLVTGLTQAALRVLYNFASTSPPESPYFDLLPELRKRQTEQQKQQPKATPPPVTDAAWKDALLAYARSLSSASEADLTINLFSKSNSMDELTLDRFERLLAESTFASAAGTDPSRPDYWGYAARLLWPLLGGGGAAAPKQTNVPASIPDTKEKRLAAIANRTGNKAKILFHNWNGKVALSREEAVAFIVSITKDANITTAITDAKKKGKWTVADVNDLAKLIGNIGPVLGNFPTKEARLKPNSVENAMRKEAGLGLVIASEMMEAHHPFNAQIHSTLQPLAGAYPAYYNVLHTKQDMSKDAPFAGDVAAVYRKYHAFAGVPQFPEAIASGNAPDAIPKRPPTKPIASVLVGADTGAIPKRPPTVPIGTSAGSTRMLNLVPVECGHCGGVEKKSAGSDSDEDEEVDAQIGCHTSMPADDDDADDDDVFVECGMGAPNARAAKKSSKPKSTYKMRAPATSAAPVQKKLPGFEDIFL